MSINAPITENQKKCICIYEPRGQCGLEGYAKGDQYRYEFFLKDVSGRPYYRVYPVENDNYYETCSVATFTRFFQPIVEVTA